MNGLRIWQQAEHLLRVETARMEAELRGTPRPVSLGQRPVPGRVMKPVAIGRAPRTDTAWEAAVMRLGRRILARLAGVAAQ